VSLGLCGKNQGGLTEAAEQRIRLSTHTGRPLGSENFVVKLEKILDRMLRPKKAGRKPKKRTQKMGSEREK
jgi:hypothetical protein